MSRFGTLSCDCLVQQQEVTGTPGGPTRPGRLWYGSVWQIANPIQGQTNVNTTFSILPGTGNLQASVRFYLKVLKYPNSQLRLAGFNGSIEGTDSLMYITLDNNGKLNAWDKGNSAALLVAIGAQILVLNQWYRIDATCIPSPIGLAPFIKARIDGINVINTFSSRNHVNQLVGQVRFGAFNNLSEMDGGIIQIDDAVYTDEITPPGPGGITILKITGQGIYNNWLNGILSYKAVQHTFMGGRSNATNECVSNSVSGAKTSYTLETLAQYGVPSNATIKSVRVILAGVFSNANAQLILRYGGTEILSGLIASQHTGDNGGWIGNVNGGATNGGWLINNDAIAVPIKYTDALEIGIIEGAGVALSKLMGAGLIVDWETPAEPIVVGPTESAAAPLISVVGTYVGNGTFQQVNFADPTLKPTMLIIQSDLNGGNARALWHTGMAEDGELAYHPASQFMEAQFNIGARPGLMRVRTGSFDVVGPAGSLNENGITYRYVAVKDFYGKFTQSAIAQWDSSQSGPVTLDNFNVSLSDLTFPVEAMFFHRLAPGSVVSNTSNVYHRNNGYVADITSIVDTSAADIADVIQSQGIGTFQFGKLAFGSSQQQAWFAFRKFFPNTNLIDFGQYVGNAAGARVIPISNLGAFTPAFVLVIPANAVSKYYRFFNDGAGVNARTWSSGAVNATAITAFNNINQFTVDATLNAGAITYYYFVLYAFVTGGLVVSPTGGVVVDGGVAGTNQLLLSKDISGIYFINPGKTSDTILVRSDTFDEIIPFRYILDLLFEPEIFYEIQQINGSISPSGTPGTPYNDSDDEELENGYSYITSTLGDVIDTINQRIPNPFARSGFFG